jgi:predicted PurR-regulated permease PerM
MTVQRQIGFWVAALVALVLALWLLSPIMLPFIAGLALAYFLDPVADALENLGLPRLAASLVILIASILVLALLLVLVVPVVGSQVGRLATEFPNLLPALVQHIQDIAPQWLKDILPKSEANIQATLADLAKTGAGWLLSLASTLLSGGKTVIDALSLLVVTPIVAFYMLLDWDRMVAKVDSWVPRRQLETVRTIFRDIDTTMAGFIRGQGTLCLFLGAFYAVTLSLAGLNFGLAIGIMTGVLSFIPYFGAITGGVLSIGIALVQFWPAYPHILLVVGIFAIGQFIEGNILSPKLVGHSIGLHPVWLMFALFAFGYLFGFVGLLLAVPLAAAAGVLSRFALRQYLASNLYRGIDPPAPMDPPA